MTSRNTLDTFDIRYMLECFSKHQLIAVTKILDLIISGVKSPEILRYYLRSIRRESTNTRRVTPFSFSVDYIDFGTFWDHGEDLVQARHLVRHLQKNYDIKMEISRGQAKDAEFFEDSFYDDIDEAIQLSHE